MRHTFLAIAATLALPAAAPAATYSVELSAVQTGKIIARDVLWSCAGATCSGATDYSRPLVVCQSLAKKAGRIANFRVDGRPLGQTELERCNASAKPAANVAQGAN